MIPSDTENTNSSVIKDLFMNEFMKEEISEKIRLLYVALTRAREKIIIYLPKKESKTYNKKTNGTIEDEKRIKYLILSEMIYSCVEDLNKYLSYIELKDLNLSKNYLYKKSRKNIECVGCEKIDVEEISIQSEEIKDKHFSHENFNIVNQKTHDNMVYGTKIHEVLELIDFKNYNPSIIKDEFVRNKITKFLNNDLLKNIKDSNIYHEYEFIYNKDNTKYHGIIDLMIEYKDHIDIIDYKLKDVTDEDYIKQLNGYKEYIGSISNKKVNTYLYSIIEENFKEIK
jgi:ATP-dependent exoDNAse (exonuclease V) beta subunit